MNDITISICIPTYNGEEYVLETLEYVADAIKSNNDIELIINDDCSTDRTYEILKKFEKTNTFTKVFKNDRNMGMDINFTNTVNHSSGIYVWLLGQDDYISEKAIIKAKKILNDNDVSFIYWNYFFFSSFNNKDFKDSLTTNDEAYYKDSDSFFREIKDAPSFLGANFMKKEYYDNTDISKYFCTYYVQMGVWLENIKNGNIFVVGNSEYIGCRMPENSWKTESPQMKLDTAIGNLYTYYVNSNLSSGHRYVFNLHKRRFEKVVVPRLPYSISKGLENSDARIVFLKKIYSSLFDRAILYLYIYPIMKLSKRFCSILVSIIDKVIGIEKLRKK